MGKIVTMLLVVEGTILAFPLAGRDSGKFSKASVRIPIKTGAQSGSFGYICLMHDVNSQLDTK